MYYEWEDLNICIRDCYLIKVYLYFKKPNVILIYTQQNSFINY